MPQSLILPCKGCMKVIDSQSTIHEDAFYAGSGLLTR